MYTSAQTYYLKCPKNTMQLLRTYSVQILLLQKKMTKNLGVITPW
jgi:hypothetical protein